MRVMIDFVELERTVVVLRTAAASLVDVALDVTSCCCCPLSAELAAFVPEAASTTDAQLRGLGAELSTSADELATRASSAASGNLVGTADSAWGTMTVGGTGNLNDYVGTDSAWGTMTVGGTGNLSDYAGTGGGQPFVTVDSLLADPAYAAATEANAARLNAEDANRQAVLGADMDRIWSMFGSGPGTEGAVSNAGSIAVSRLFLGQPTDPWALPEGVHSLGRDGSGQELFGGADPFGYTTHDPNDWQLGQQIDHERGSI